MATTGSYQERRVRRRVIALILLLLALALAAWLLYNYYVNRTVPIPNVEAVKPGDKILPPEYLFSIDGIPQSPLRKPQDAIVHPNGKIYVTDTGNGRVAVFDRNGRFLSSFRDLINGKTLMRPIYLAVDNAGLIYVSDRELSNIFIFKEDGKFLRPFLPDRRTDFEWKPLEITFDKQGNLFITDILKVHHLLGFARDGKLRFSVGATGQVVKATDTPEKFSFPNGVAVDRGKGDVYVADSDNGRIQVFDNKGKFIKLLPTTGLPRGIVFDHRGRLLIVDTLGHNVMVYDKKGDTLTTFGVGGYGPGQFQYPNGLDFSKSDRRIYVTDRENNRVQVWVYGPEIAPSLAGPVKAIKNWWWLLPLALLLWYLWSKRKKHVMHEDFLKAAVSTNMLELVVKKLKRLHVTEEVMERYKDLEIGEEKKKFEDVFRIKSHFEDLVDEFMKEFKLAQPEATILSASKKGMARIVLLAEDEALLDAADAVEVKNMNFGDFLEKYGEEADARY
ncbi:MAG: 6-bladed beta-propeller [Actinobacteria bacterium]|nr:6-bladed beta-propeller [Actinomycetota bacterium]